MGHAGQGEAAESFLQQLAALSVLLGQGPSALAFAQQQKIDGEELLAVAFLQTMAGNPSAAQQSLQRFASSHPWVAPRAIEVRQTINEVAAAVHGGNGQSALTHAATIPEFITPVVMFLKARALLLNHDYSPAEAEFRNVLMRERSLANGQVMTDRFPVFGILSHYYLGQLYEATGKRDQSINEYQEFLSHFQPSQTSLPQIGEARTALKRLMQ